MTMPCSNTFYELSYNALQGHLELSGDEELRLHILAEEEAINVLTGGSDELLQDMMSEYQEEIAQAMKMALLGKDSFVIGLQLKRVADKMVSRVSQMESIWDKANEKFNDMRSNEK